MQKLNEFLSGGGGDGEGTNDNFLEDGSEGLCSLSTTQVFSYSSSSLSLCFLFTESLSLSFDLSENVRIRGIFGRWFTSHVSGNDQISHIH